ncbi:MAG: 2-keto-4-pentenoate hydratase/2-oxohepta-3-ene-1,7-dioic acid hydratase in catechol pathway [Hyphomicrobiaceae bacterium]|jgi:2-keto-4-pentenoate hydratase/2-oxohepta-3-ene-1,7-dioic acid hydratase in catechol pathway
MKIYATTVGVAIGDGDTLAILDVPYPDLGTALSAGVNLADLASAGVRTRISEPTAQLLAPIARPGKIVCIGANYQCHLKEMRGVLPDFELPDRPVFFVVPGSAVTGPHDPIVLPSHWPEQVDYEAELAVVIGRTAKNITANDAWDHIAGLTMANDVSARDIQLEAMTGGHEFTLAHAKGLDTFKPIGPGIVTPDEFSFPLDLEIGCKINGTARQCARTTALIQDIPSCVAYVSRFMRLDPGDIICTGSPAGSGFFRGAFLRDGDTVEVHGQGIGSLRNPVVLEGRKA